MKVSIITVSFNSEKTIRSTIESVLNQSYSNIEYIIIDGKSVDGTVDIIQEYAPVFGQRLKWLSERDKGLYDAMNKGIRMATGNLVGILNSDDFFTSNKVLAIIAEEFERGNIDAVYGDVHFVNPDDLIKPVRYYSSKVFRRSLMRMGFMPAHPTFYARRECFIEYGFYKTDYKICADFDLLLRFVYVNNVKLKYIPLDMVTMRLGGVSTGGVKSHMQIMKEHLRSFNENGIRSNAFLLSMRYLYKLTEFLRSE